MDDHPYGWLSLLPPLIAILLAIITRRAVISLVVGVLFGALITSGGNPLTAVWETCEVHLWPTLIDPGKMRVFAFTLLMGAMVGVISKSGGMQGLVNLLAPFARGRRSGQFTTWLLGLIVFFDDYTNTILLGSTLRGVCDRLAISREKLAYLVDSTAAPVASLALLSTWIAVELDYIQDGLAGIQNAGTQNAASLSPIELFIASIPYRFYAVMALLLVPMIALSGRDFGAMLKAERATQSKPNAEDESLREYTASDQPARWYNAVVPIAVTLIVVVWLIYRSGKQSTGDDASLRDIVGAADSSMALMYGSLLGTLTAAFLCRVQQLLDKSQIVSAAVDGMRIVLPAIIILWTASALSRMTGNKSVEGSASQTEYDFKQHRLYTAEYLAAQVLPDDESSAGSQGVSTTIRLMPTIVFLLAAVLSFATGTSFGTMGILMPMTVTLSCNLLMSQQGTIDPTNPILLASVASVLSGAVFGDHCSPISDTTILSSQASGCDHMAHVMTQLPYALLVGGVTVVLGTLPIGWGVNVWVLLPIQLITLAAVLVYFGKS